MATIIPQWRARARTEQVQQLEASGAASMPPARALEGTRHAARGD
jgi:hypothetical protein